MYRRDERGRIRVPVAMDTPGGGVADGGMWVSPGDPDYPMWNQWLSHHDAQRGHDEPGGGTPPPDGDRR